jgi:NAD(P)-dependent dehydrogenase (short-subunit alcohol dehydrogenase family)
MAPPTPAPPFTKTTHHNIYPAISPAPDGALVNSAKGLTVLVSGAGRGIGRAEAIVFAQAGAKKVVIAARSTNELSEVEVAIKGVAPKTEVIKVETDVMDEKSVAALFHQAGEVHGMRSGSLFFAQRHTANLPNV